MVSEPVSKFFGTEKSLGTGLRENLVPKSPRTGLGENLVPKKVPEPVLFSFGYTNIDISNDNNWGGWWGFGTARIAEISVFLLKSLLYHV